MYRVRFLLSEPADGAMNMALDEALLESAAQAGGRGSGRAGAALRIYQWAQPTLSLGYFQAAAEREGHAASRDCDLIRRPSGGGAILHDRELTYALVLPAVIAQGEAASGWYDKVHNALIDAIGELTGASATLCENPPKLAASDEPFLCFQRRTSGDVLLGRHKVAGSAQRRRRGAILQHGSVLLARSPHAPELPGIADVAQQEVDFSQFARAFSHTIGQGLNLALEISHPTEMEQRIASELQQAKYGSDVWTRKR